MLPKGCVHLSVSFCERSVYCGGRQECSSLMVRLEELRSLRVLEMEGP